MGTVKQEPLIGRPVNVIAVYLSGGWLGKFFYSSKRAIEKIPPLVFMPW